MWKVPLFELNYDDKESKAVHDVINSKWLTMGTKTVELEKKFSTFMGTNVLSTAVSSCTAAIHLSLLAGGVKRGDEVIIPSLSFVSQLNIIKNIGATPILIDCNSMDDWNINTDLIKKRITKKTRAIIILHYAGYPCKISYEFLKYCKKHKIVIIEDVAHAPGAEVNSKKCGTIGDFGCFSFFSNKNLSAGEGGIVTTKNKILDKKIKLLRSHGMTVMSLDKAKGRAVNYDVVGSGLNYRIDEIRSALAIEQLKKLVNGNNQRAQYVHLYKKELINTKISFPFNLHSNAKNAYHIMPILLPTSIDRNNLIDFLKVRGIQTSLHYPAYWNFKVYKHLFNKKDYPICNQIISRTLTLPLYPSMGNNKVKLVCNNLKEFINE